MPNITPTIPLARELLAHECLGRGLDKITKKPLDPKKHYMVLYKGLTKPGIINLKPVDFIKKYWANCTNIANPALEVTFVGWNFTVNGTMTDLCDWVRSGLLPGEKSVS
jgi:hypothetical protein